MDREASTDFRRGKQGWYTRKETNKFNNLKQDLTDWNRPPKPLYQRMDTVTSWTLHVHFSAPGEDHILSRICLCNALSSSAANLKIDFKSTLKLHSSKRLIDKKTNFTSVQLLETLQCPGERKRADERGDGNTPCLPVSLNASRARSFCSDGFPIPSQKY